MGRRWGMVIGFLVVNMLVGVPLAEAQQAKASHILIHMKTSLSEDDAQICAVPNVAGRRSRPGTR